MYAPYQVWKFHPDNLESINWYIFHLKKQRPLKTTVGNKTKVINADWVFYDSEDEDWNVLDTKRYEITDNWKLVPLDELKVLWREQMYPNANFSLIDIAERKPRAWVHNSRMNMNPRGKPVFSEHEALKLVKIWGDQYKEPDMSSQFKSGGLFWIFQLNLQIIFDTNNSEIQINDDWLVYNFHRDSWEGLDSKLKNNVNDKTCQRISYETLYNEWENFFDKSKSKPSYINLQDIAEDTT